MLVEATRVDIEPAEVRALEALRHTGVMVTLYDDSGLAIFRNPAAHAAIPLECSRFGDHCHSRESASALWEDALATGQATSVLEVKTVVGQRWHRMILRRSVDPATGDAAVLVDESDMTAEVLLHARIRHAAEHDPLTGLLNREGFALRLEEAIAGSTRYTLFLVDLDRFRAVNDEHGHAACNAVLIAAASRIKQTAGSDAPVARLGGDEFAALVPGELDTQQAAELAVRIATALRSPVQHIGVALRVGASVGYVTVPAGTPGDVALQKADAAMYRVKRSGRQGQFDAGATYAISPDLAA